MAPSPASVEVLDDLVRARPLLRRDDEVDIAAAEPVERVIGGASCLDAHPAQLVAPRQRGRLLLEGADGLPVLKAGVCYRHRRVPRGAAPWKPPEGHAHSLGTFSQGPLSRSCQSI